MAKKGVSLGILGIFLLSTTSQAATTGTYKFTKDYPTPAGTVSFSHDRHADTYTQDCHFCHSALKIFGGEVNEVFGHSFCTDCHLKQSSLPEGDCTSCHDRSSAESER